MKKGISEILEQRDMDYLIKGFNSWGIEKTEEKIKELYQGDMQKYYLKIYKNLIKGGDLYV